jgi:UrcA family protein
MKHVTMLVAAAVLALGSANTGAFAAEKRVVSYGDLDLSKSAGRAIFTARLQSAAVSVCGKKPRQIEFRLRDMHEACVQKATDRAIASLPPSVAEMFDGSDVQEAALP